MGAKIKLDTLGRVEPPTLVLATKKGKKLGVVPAYDIVFKDCMNACSEISFRVNKYDNGQEYSIWSDILDFKLLWCREYDLWFEINVEVDESNELVKNVSGKTVCEAELSQINLYNIEINTEDDIARDDYEEPTVFYNAEYPDISLLNRLSEKIPHYTIRHVDSTLASIQRTFSFDNTSIYDAFQEIAEEIGCLFVFGSNSNTDGTIARSISVYDLQSNCVACGNRDEFTDVCPECGSKNIICGYGKDTGIFVSAENLADRIVYSTDTGSVKNCFKLETGDDLMDATVRNCNPNGTDYLWYISDSTKQDMSKDLVNRINSYNELYNECQNTRKITISADSEISTYNDLVEKYNPYRPSDEQLEEISDSIIGFPALMNAYYNTIDLSLFLESGLMPSLESEETTAAKQVALLTRANLSPVAVTDKSSVTETVANNAVLGIAKILISSSYTVKIKTSLLSGLTWKGSFEVVNNNDEDDTATTSTISVTINSDVEKYLGQKVQKLLKAKDTDKYSITGLFSLGYTDFCTELEKYSLNCLTSFNDACQAVLDVLIEYSSSEKDSIYQSLYSPYYEKLRAIRSEISTREDEILDVDTLQNTILGKRNNIQSGLNFETYLGDTLWKEFCAYRREDTYRNSNYISDGLDNAELFEKGMEFIETASKEIYKSAELQHSISSTLKNLLAMEEFQSLTQNFEVGNWLRFKVDDKVYKLRLLDYEIDYSDLENISVTFSDVAKVSGGYSDLESIFKKASSMATSYDSIKHQASQGDKSNKRINNWVEKGLSLTNSFISDSDNQEVVLDSHGFIVKEYSPITESYSDKQLKIINKGLYVTDDNWETSRAGIGNFIYYNPNTGKTVEKYGVIADTLVGNMILGENVGVYTTGNTITLNKNGLKIIGKEREYTHTNIYGDIVTITESPAVTINANAGNLFTVSNGVDDVLWFDEEGNGYFSGELSIGDDNFIVDKDGNVTMNGGITLSGDIDFSGSGMFVELYSPERDDIETPTKKYSTYSETSATYWHRIFDSANDRYVCYSTDGGKNWGTPQKITCLTYISKTGIYTGTLTANNIQGGFITTGGWDSGGDADGCINMCKQLLLFKDKSGLSESYDRTKMMIGFLEEGDTNIPIIIMGAGTGTDGYGKSSGRGYIEKSTDSFNIYYNANNVTGAAYIKMDDNANIIINGIEFAYKGDKYSLNFADQADYWDKKLELASSNIVDPSNNKAVVDVSIANLQNICNIDGDLKKDVVGAKFKDANNLGYLCLSSEGGEYADIVFKRTKDDVNLFRVFDSSESDSMATLMLANYTIGHATADKFAPENTWDFTGATVKNLKVTFG